MIYDKTLIQNEISSLKEKLKDHYLGKNKLSKKEKEQCAIRISVLEDTLKKGYAK